MIKESVLLAVWARDGIFAVLVGDARGKLFEGSGGGLQCCAV
jgi:hypothetical protein